MIRVVIENIILFLLPTVIYAAYVAATRTDTRKGILDDAPLVWLLMAGTGLVIVILVAFGSTSGGKPGQVYVPPSLKNGHIEPGHID
ncbi:MAG: DUF6111 family protein [Hyphomicrobiaceae bacterium]|nr:DUF6111 family protein [Hyphomicrobiaceae bacterium]